MARSDGVWQEGMGMRHLCSAIVLILLMAAVSDSFEIDGLVSGMSMEKARKKLEESFYKSIQVRDNSIVASGNNRFLLLNFCKNELVLVQNHLPPGFDNFVRRVEEKRKELGKPSDAWTEPADPNLIVGRNSVSFLWKDNLTSVKITFAEFASNRQLDVTYENRNSCRQVQD